MFDIRKPGVHVAATSLAFALCAIGFDAAASAVEPTKAAKQDSEHERYEVNKAAKQKGALTPQQELDLQHELAQTEGVDHPREITGAAKKPALKNKKSSPATQKDLDLKHDLVQADGVDHPREIAAVAKKPALKNKKSSPATQKDKDLEHDLVQTDGVNHPREVLKK